MEKECRPGEEQEGPISRSPGSAHGDDPAAPAGPGAPRRHPEASVSPLQQRRIGHSAGLASVTTARRTRAAGKDNTELFQELARLPEGPERQAVREALSQRYQPLVTSIAMRYRDRGEPLEDLLQVGRLGLLHSIDRFDLSRGVKFITYASTTILGEIKRYFRDQSWGLKVPRRLQELNISLRRAAERLGHELGRSPTIAELAHTVGESEERTLEALELGRQAHGLMSLDHLAHLEEDRPTGAERLASTVKTDSGAQDTSELHTLLAQLPPRLQKILTWKFIEGHSQIEVAKRLGISQMHVSRLQTRAIQMLRKQLGQQEGPWE